MTSPNEIVCHICGVGFRLHRLRRKSEDAGLGPGKYNPFLGEELERFQSQKNMCAEGSGCEQVHWPNDRDLPVSDEEVSWPEQFIRWMVSRDIDQETANEKFQRTSNKIDAIDRLKNLVHHCKEVRDSACFAEADSEPVASEEGSQSSQFLDTTSGFGLVAAPDAREEGKDDISDNEEAASETSIHSISEHVAGPGCTDEAGYSGHEITAGEMRYCLTWQALCRKTVTRNTGPEEDDEDFECEGGIFLSGLCDEMADFDELHGAEIWPVRHGVDYAPSPVNSFPKAAADMAEYSMPFHPYCFEIFRHTSLKRYGAFDPQHLMDWFAIEHRYEDFHGLPRHPDVIESRRNGIWRHLNGTAYLSACPLASEKLTEVLRSFQVTDITFDMQDGAFRALLPPTSAVSSDPFMALSNELRYQILGELCSRDIAALRLTSRSFRQLPVWIFQDLIQREMPWLWEARQNAQQMYSKWTVVTQEDPDRDMDLEQRTRYVLETTVEFALDDCPDSKRFFKLNLDSWVAEALKWRRRQRAADRVILRTPFKLDADKTHWSRLYSMLTREADQLKGLRNRARIWRDCEKILRRIDLYQRTEAIPISADIRGLVAATEWIDLG